MSLTLETAKHAINKYGRVIDIVDDAGPLSAYSVTREEAFKASKSGVSLKPCIVVTTAREALDAAWELAYETDQIPANTPHIYRTSDNVTHTSEGRTVDLYAGHGRSRLIDPPEPEPEPWEESRFCYANGDFYERFQDSWGAYWKRPAETLLHRRKDLAKLNPKPVTIEGEDE